ncbi:hypothetical protein GCM10009737_10800 [Nocardioides lentus]|uniref:Uncharacterized protein n=1 Tax=Nocardioides lentus TaxID=338077 RepID=A0ABN2P369_9ACTN
MTWSRATATGSPAAASGSSGSRSAAGESLPADEPTGDVTEDATDDVAEDEADDVAVGAIGIAPFRSGPAPEWAAGLTGAARAAVLVVLLPPKPIRGRNPRGHPDRGEITSRAPPQAIRTKRRNR